MFLTKDSASTIYDKSKGVIIKYHIQLIEVVKYILNLTMDKYMHCEMVVWVCSVFEKGTYLYIKITSLLYLKLQLHKINTLTLITTYFHQYMSVPQEK